MTAESRARETKRVLATRAFGFDHPERELRKALLHAWRGDRLEVEPQDIINVGGELLRHQRLTARDGFQSMCRCDSPGT
jgi:hypothetical protein